MSSPAESSTNIGASLSSPAAVKRFPIRRCFSSFGHRFLLSRHMLMWARPATMRFVSASTGISREKIITGWRLPPSAFTGGYPPPPSVSICPSAALSAMFIARDVLPTDGRAAITIISAFFSPWSFSSRCLSPVESPSKVTPVDENIALILLKLSSTAADHDIVLPPWTPISRKDFSASPRTACGSGYSRSS